MQPFLGSALLGTVLATTPVLAVSRDLPQAITPDKSATLTVADFLRGMEVLSKIGPVRAEQDPAYVSALRGLTHIGESYRVDYEKAKSAGTTLDSCPVGGLKMTTDTLVPFLLRLPPEQRSMPMDKAFRLHMRELYPCPATGETP
ncbi:hypothetical protein SAMN05518669_112192 [Variovorax sp. YR634]|nr:hypothetical protein SAMN05518669_112192 [Variovorax sp. YR634]